MEWEPPTPDGRFFDEETFTRIKILFSRIFPACPEHGVPGADDADAADFLDHLLAFDASVYREIPDWRRLYQHAIPLLNEAARQEHGGGIEDLTVAQIDALLSRLSTGEVADLPEDFNQSRFFSTLRKHCIQGCFADTRWGGNKDEIMWRWLGYRNDREDFT